LVAVLNSPLSGLKVTESRLETSKDGGIVVWSGGIEELSDGKVSVGKSGGVWVIVPLSNGIGGWDETNFMVWKERESQLWVSLVEHVFGIHVEEPVLGFILKNLLFNENVEWSWTIINSGENEIVLNIFTGEHVEVHADTWLHGGSDWLGEEFSSIWHLVTLSNGDIEINIRVEWDWLSTNWSPGVSITVGKVVWAVEEGSSSLGQLWDGKIPTFPDLRSSKGEDLWSSIGLVGKVSNDGTVLKVSLPLNGSPCTKGTLLSGTSGFDINSNS